MFQVLGGFICEKNNNIIIFDILNISNVFNISIQTLSTPQSVAAPLP